MKAKLVVSLIAMLNTAPSLAFNIDAVGKTGRDAMFDTRSCNELYVQATALERETFLSKHDYYTNSNAQIAGIASTFFAPAIYYFGYAAYKDFDSKSRSKSAAQAIEEVRTRLAEKRCFDR